MGVSAPRPPYSCRHRHAEQIVFQGQRNQLLIVPPFEIVKIFDRPQFAAEGIDVGE